jgi:hypothetical protein
MISIMSMFLRRTYQEMILDNREMVFMNILNQDIQRMLGGEGKDIEHLDELPKFSLYTDPEVWNPAGRNRVGSSSILNINSNPEKVKALFDLVEEFYRNFEHLNIDQANISRWSYGHHVIGQDVSNEVFDTVMTEITTQSWDSNFVPKSDMQNFNYILHLHVLNLYRAGNTEALVNFTLK